MTWKNLIAQKRIILTMGPGGVGKTSIASILGLQAAKLGKRALVLTIDPALRLADALGLSDITPGEPVELSPEQMQPHGIRALASLTIAMLDTERSLAEMITREVKDPGLRKKILKHPFFLRLCNDLAGSREYAAMEEIHHLYRRSDFDLLIVDTPPTVHGMQFLEAPDRILNVLEHDGYSWLIRPALRAGNLGLKALDFSGGYVIRTISKFTGFVFLKELAAFIDLFVDILEGFRQRASETKATLQSSKTALVLVTTVDPTHMDETSYLYRQLVNHNLTPATIVVNRLTPKRAGLPTQPNWRTWLKDKLISMHSNDSIHVESVLASMERAYHILDQLAQRDQNRLKQMKATLNQSSPLVCIPLLSEDVHDLNGLEKMRRLAFDLEDYAG